MKTVKLYECENITNNEGFKAYYKHTDGLELVRQWEDEGGTYEEYSSENDSIVTVKARHDRDTFNLKYILIEEITQ